MFQVANARTVVAEKASCVKVRDCNGSNDIGSTHADRLQVEASSRCPGCPGGLGPWFKTAESGASVAIKVLYSSFPAKPATLAPVTHSYLLFCSVKDLCRPAELLQAVLPGCCAAIQGIA